MNAKPLPKTRPKINRDGIMPLPLNTIWNKGASTPTMLLMKNIVCHHHCQTRTTAKHEPLPNTNSL